ncbi:hypothetical protein HN51_053546 [Arachis hypogaea]|uniref:Uncharacterized protein n=1 Tax=Arachis hypogaea TaxID=3818 RepID=A0A444XD81_ARAHY|nr:uncharacterized protein LOC107616968 [Arachis ipaensis]XP_025677313.1 uncharacterized protein LOC112777213 [Arachis hypogaea]QHN75905.1 uncharacterized protein DS421_19g639390 [Arachis hypogaea]RYQ87423.1 hypothetical protein Ahy_B09g094940 [Arachis hypogaea]
MEKRSCSIELEPRTLSQVQLIQVREVAADVVQKLEPREASALFVEGLMHPMKDENGGKIEKAEDILNDDDDDEIKECECQCSFNNENTNHVNLKEPLSAPF